jgi:hypothetical protein
MNLLLLIFQIYFVSSLPLNLSFLQENSSNYNTSENSLNSNNLNYSEIDSSSNNYTSLASLNEMNRDPNYSDIDSSSSISTNLVSSNDKKRNTQVCYGSNFKDGNGKCQPCSSNCLTCSSLHVCLTCNYGERLYSLKMCEKDCPPSTYAYKTFCYDCPKNCLTCTSDSICTSCKGLAILNTKSQCQMQCGINEFLYNNECYKCPFSCKVCEQNKGCTSCLTGYILYNGNCVLDCPQGTFKKNDFCFKIVSCPSGYFQDLDNNGQCSLCGQDCLNCVTKLACYQCDGNLNLIGYEVTTNKYYEVIGKVGMSNGYPVVYLQSKNGNTFSSNFKFGYSECMTIDQMKLLKSLNSSNFIFNLFGLIVMLILF